MDTWQAISSMRAVRRFGDRPLKREHLLRILNAGRRAGSTHNEQAWDFIVCTDREHLAKLAWVGDDDTRHLADAAAAIALITPDPLAPGAQLSLMWDLGHVAQNMMLAAWELGIGSVPATVDKYPLVQSLLGYPDTHRCEFLLSFGYPADGSDMTRPNRSGGRKRLEEIVHDERWGAALDCGE